jgi:hypothetical protein
MPAIPNAELLARFVTSSRWYRSGDQTVKPDAFIPYPFPDLSVTRHEGITDAQLWEIGQRIVEAVPQRPNLHGRADVTAGDVRITNLEVEPSPVPTNPNHADIIGWPNDKPSQKARAQQLAAMARLTLKPQA